MNSSQEDHELENLLSQIVDGELQVSKDDADEVELTEENGAEDKDADAVATDLGQALASLVEETDADDDKNDDNPSNLEENIVENGAVEMTEGDETEFNATSTPIQMEIIVEEVVIGEEGKAKGQSQEAATASTGNA
jgi:hypothetical protein